MGAPIPPPPPIRRLLRPSIPLDIPEALLLLPQDLRQHVQQNNTTMATLLPRDNSHLEPWWPTGINAPVVVADPMQEVDAVEDLMELEDNINDDDDELLVATPQDLAAAAFPEGLVPDGHVRGRRGGSCLGVKHFHGLVAANSHSTDNKKIPYLDVEQKECDDDKDVPIVIHKQHEAQHPQQEVFFQASATSAFMPVVGHCFAPSHATIAAGAQAMTIKMKTDLETLTDLFPTIAVNHDRPRHELLKALGLTSKGNARG